MSPVRIVAAVTAGVVAASALVLVAPRDLRIDPATGTGDPGLQRRTLAALALEPGQRHRISVVEITPGRVRQAHFGGAGGSTVFEVGSVTKTMTAALYEDAVDRGEVTPDTRLGDVLDLRGAPAADVTLEELASHRAGLPRLAPGVGPMLGGALANLRAADPYDLDLPGLLDAARDVALEGRGEVRYSNLGFALLGQAVAAGAGASWSDLVAERVLRAAGMTRSTAPTSAADLPPGAPHGFTASGRDAEPWTMGAEAPAGSVRSTPDDLARYVRALLAGDLPGAEALEPRFADGDRRIGAAWFTESVDGTDVTWHNGGTGGYRSMVALDRAAGRAVVVLSDTAVPVDATAFELLVPGSQQVS